MKYKDVIKKFNRMTVNKKSIFLAKLIHELTTDIRLLTKLSPEGDETLNYCWTMNELIRHFIEYIISLSKNDEVDLEFLWNFFEETLISEPGVKGYVGPALMSTMSFVEGL